MQTRSFWSPCSLYTVSWPVRDEVHWGASQSLGFREGERVTEAGAVEQPLRLRLLWPAQTGCELTAAHLRQPAGFTRSASFIHRGRGGRREGESLGRKPRLGWGDRRPRELSFATGLHQPQGETDPAQSLWAPQHTLTLNTPPPGVNSLSVPSEPAEDDLLKLFLQLVCHFCKHLSTPYQVQMDVRICSFSLFYIICKYSIFGFWTLGRTKEDF